MNAKTGQLLGPVPETTVYWTHKHATDQVWSNDIRYRAYDVPPYAGLAGFPPLVSAVLATLAPAAPIPSERRALVLKEIWQQEFETKESRRPAEAGPAFAFPVPRRNAASLNDFSNGA